MNKQLNNYIHIYIYIYICIHIVFDVCLVMCHVFGSFVLFVVCCFATLGTPNLPAQVSLLRFVDSTFPGNPLWT